MNMKFTNAIVSVFFYCQCDFANFKHQTVNGKLVTRACFDAQCTFSQIDLSNELANQGQACLGAYWVFSYASLQSLSRSYMKSDNPSRLSQPVKPTHGWVLLILQIRLSLSPPFFEVIIGRRTKTLGKYKLPRTSRIRYQ
jgi:hypothetical protein